MKSEIRVSSPNIKTRFVIGLFATILIIFLSLVYRFEFGLILLAIGGTIALTGFFIVLGVGNKIVYRMQVNKLDLEHKRQELRLIVAKANKAELESFVLSFPSSQRQLVSPDAPVRLIEATANSYKELPEDTRQAPLDLLTVFTQATQSYACIGGQQTGKTYQMRHIAAYWLNRGIHPVVIGPKWDKGEWKGCHLVGGNGDFAEVSRGIARVSQVAQERHQSDLRHKEHSILPVFFDDWTPIVDAVDNAREMVLQATTLYASVNIILYFILHSDTANAWGVDRKGAALKDNFIKLFIIPHYDTTGLIVRDKTRGFIKFAGDNVEYPVKLFSGPVGDSKQIVIGDDFINLDVEPSVQEAEILRLYRQGESYRTISQTVYGQFGQFYNEKIEQVLQKFGEK